jgi:zinc protease
MKKRFILTVLTAIAVVFMAAVVPADELPELKIEKYELPNGLDVILHEDHTIPMISVNIWYHVGSKNEKPGRTGFAHLFEHMMFEGSEHHNTDYSEAINKYGGVYNGSTSEDCTNYWENMPSNYLEKALWLEADRMGYLLPAMTQERLDNQRDVVKNERRYRYDNQPYAKAYDLMPGLIYPDGHPYHHSVIGSMEDLSAASLDDVKEFFRLYYTPNNASLCIAGDFDPVLAKEWVKKYFGPIPAGEPIDRLEKWIPKLTVVKRASSTDNVSLPRLYMEWVTPPYYAPGDAEFDLLASILSSGKTSRLYKTLVYDKQIAQDVSARQSSTELSSTFGITVTAKEGVSLEDIEREVDTILDDLLENGISESELEAARTGWESSFMRRIQTIGGFGGRANLLNSYNVYLGDPGRLNWDMERYTEPTVDDVMKFAREYLDMNGRMILYILPQGDLKASEEKPDMAITPETAPEPSFTPPEIQTATLSNGMELYLVEDHNLPLIQVNLLIKSGWAADPSDRPGTAALTAELLNEGTKNRNALEISDEAQRLGAILNAGSEFDDSYVQLNSLKKNIDPALDLMADIVLNPTFPEDELERQRQIYLGRIQQEARQPFTSAYKAFNIELYGEGHPYAEPYTGSGTEASIKALSKSDLEDFYKSHYFPNNTAAIVVGDITMNEAKSKLEKTFKKWKPGNVPEVEVAAVKPLQKTKVCIVDKPGAVQSVIIIGNSGLMRKDSDFLPTLVMNNALGGHSNSRINMNLREDKGYTYGAFSTMTTRKGQGAFIAYAEVQTEVTKDALAEFMKELKGISGDNPLTNKELTESKDNLIKGFPQDFQTVGGIAGQLETMVTYDLPLNEWSTYINRVSAVDLEAATMMAKKHIHPNTALIVVVGDKNKIEPGIRELNLGEIVDLDSTVM